MNCPFPLMSGRMLTPLGVRVTCVIARLGLISATKISKLWSPFRPTRSRSEKKATCSPASSIVGARLKPPRMLPVELVICVYPTEPSAWTSARKISMLPSSFCPVNRPVVQKAIRVPSWLTAGWLSTPRAN
jgi:hypothetical protein